MASFTITGTITTPVTIAGALPAHRFVSQTTSVPTGVAGAPRADAFVGGEIGTRIIMSGWIGYEINGTIFVPVALGGFLGKAITGRIDVPIVMGGSLLASTTWGFDPTLVPMVLDGSITGGRSITGTIGVPMVMGGALRVDRFVTGQISTPMVQGGTLPSHRFFPGGGIITPVVLRGTIRRDLAPTGTAEDRFLATGVRPSTPLIVYSLDALRPADVTDLTDGQQFLVAGSFVGGPSDAFTQQGALASYVGTKHVPAIGSPYFSFRPPGDLEVVWSFNDGLLYRFESSKAISGLLVWKRYLSRPERTLAGQRVFEVYDPDKVYAYYARLWGAVTYEWAYDTSVLLDLIDSQRCPKFYLEKLAGNFGLALDASDPEGVQRAKIRSAVAAFKYRGLERAIALRLRALGYVGYAREVWVNPTNGANFQSAAGPNPDGSPTSGPKGAGTDWIEVPHGYSPDYPTTYWPSSRIVLHVNDLSNNPVDLTPDQREKIARELRRDVLPVHVDIRHFATDVHVGSESVGASDVLAISDVVGPPTTFNLFPDGPIYDALVVGTTCYVVGDFSMFGGEARLCAAAFDINTLAVLSWQPAFLLNADPSSRVNQGWALAVGPSGEILIGYDGYSWDPAANGGLGGYTDSGFLAVDPITAARLNPLTTPTADGSRWFAESIAVIGSAIYLFGEVPGGAVKLSSSYVVDGGFAPNVEGSGTSTTNKVFAGCRSDDGLSLYIVGQFTTIGASDTPRRAAAKISATTGQPDLAFNANVDPSNAYVYSVAADASGVYLGGYFEVLGAEVAYGVGKVNKATGVAVAGWAAGVDRFSFTNKNPLLYDGKVWWNGYFQQNGSDVDGGRSMLVQDATTGAVLDAYDLGPDGSAFCATPDGEGGVFYGGDMFAVGDFAAYGLLRIDKDTGVIVPNDHAFYRCASPSAPNNFSNSGLGETITVSITLEHQPAVGNDHTAVFHGNTSGSITEDIVDGLGNILANATLVFTHANWNVPQTFKLHCKNSGGGTVNLLIPYTVTNGFGNSSSFANIRAQQVP